MILKAGQGLPGLIGLDMATINEKALNNARQLIHRDLGDVSDLPENLRNTVVNTYYEFCCLDLELNRGPHYHPCYYRATNTVRPNQGLLADHVKFFDELAHVQASVPHIPTIISGIRGMKKSGEMEGYKLAVSVALDLFKYRKQTKGKP
jgi:hypothetical protein